GAPTTHPATTPAALAYRAAYNVKDLVGGFGMGDIDIQLVPPGTKSRYRDLLRTIELERDRAGTGVAEHEVSHAFMHHLYDENYFDFYSPKCGAHYFIEPFPEASCALSEGFAHWLALAAENGHGRSGNAYLLNGKNSWLNLERCEFSDGASSIFCQKGGEKVEGRIAGALWDLYDSTEALSPVNGGFSENSSHSLATIVETFRRHEPLTFTEFWNA
ncbi:hypothetical protein, partial [Streptosporangium sp. OZ121]|uniref:hypothetical protein n=1 Tax=Streptosporangium sp. OZ121 TaxID=3444183 RepID=UPI003F7A305A